jgi:hypothetical protein
VFQLFNRRVVAATLGLTLPMGALMNPAAQATPDATATLRSLVPAQSDSDSGPRAAKRAAKRMVARRGWDSRQYRCLVRLWQRESGWRVHAGSPGGSYGIPQAYPGTKMAGAGRNWRDDAITQIRWGLGYIEGRYASPCGAWSHFQRHLSY